MRVHAESHQAEYPREADRYGHGIRGESERTNFGFPLPGANRYYHKDNFAWPGVFHPLPLYPMWAVINPQEEYGGEAFLRMQSQVSIPHPSGLPDDAPLGGAALAEVMRGG